ncbi:MAG: nucleotide sugar dehydrogenase [Nitrososphaerales archaeon]
MRVSVIGLGFVGSSIASVWLRAGATVFGYDTSQARLKAIGEGKVSEEAGVAEAFKVGLASGKLKIALEEQELKESEIKIVCVPVYLNHGKADLSFLESACSTVARTLKKGDAVIIQPSVPPGTTRKIARPILESKSGLEAGRDFALIYSPERILVGRAIEDIETRYPAVISGISDSSLEKAAEIFGKISKKGVVKMPSIETAEMEKLAEGVYRDVNIAVANELAIVCDELGIDFFAVREAANSQPFCHIHSPGFGVGGACIPVYPVFVSSVVSETATKIIDDARGLNDSMAKLLTSALKTKFGATKDTKVGILGLAFRGDIADARLSVTYRLVDELKSIGVENILVHDPMVQSDPTLGNMLIRDLNKVLEWSDIVLLATDHSAYKEIAWDSLKRTLPLTVIDGKGILRGISSPKIKLYGLGYGERSPGIREK